MSDSVDELAARMMRIFAGSDEAHGFYGTLTERRDDGKREAKQADRRTVRQPPTLELWAQHLRGLYGLGVIPIRSDDTCVWGVIDVDKYDGLNHVELVRNCAASGVPLIVCKSKSGGAHIFCFIGEPVPAIAMQQKLREIAQFLRLPPTTEIFPKQTHVFAERGDVGNWLNMPYFDHLKGTRYALNHLGKPQPIEEFLRVAEKIVTEFLDFSAYVVTKPSAKEDDDGTFSDGPPCLEYLAREGVPNGTRNKVLFAFGVYARRAFGGSWKDKVREYNVTKLTDPLPEGEIVEILKSLAKKEYGYTCNDEPLHGCCNRPICRTREFGVGGDMPTLANLTKLCTDPPLWFVDVDDQRLELSTEALQNQRIFQKACIEKLNKAPFIIKQDEWIKILNSALEKAEMIPAPPDTSVGGQFLELLTDFVEQSGRARAKQELLLGRCWEDQGRVYFNLSALQRFLRREEFTTLSRPQLTERLRSLGGDSERFKEKGRNIYVWGVPLASLEVQTEPFDSKDMTAAEAF